MKTLLIGATIALLILSCASQPIIVDEMIQHDSLPSKKISMSEELHQRVFDCDSALNVRDMELTITRDSLNYSIKQNMGCKKLNDSLQSDLILSNFRLQKIRYYVNICMRKPSQDKFLKGWVRRALDN